MVNLTKGSHCKHLAKLLGWVMIIQVMIFPLQGYMFLSVEDDCYEVMSDFLFDQIPDENPETERDSEEENSEKDETKFHELSAQISGLPYYLANKKRSDHLSLSLTIFNKNPTPPPEG